jgi:MFS family permease
VAWTERLTGRARLPALLQQRTFRRYWGAQTISMFGDQVSAIAVPFTGILALHADAAQMGYLTAAIWLPSLLFGLHAGSWADRSGHRRRLMIGADLGRFALLATVPVCAALHVLALAQLYAVAFAVGSLSVLFTVCDPAMFVALVPEENYVRGQSLIYSSRAFSFVGGPSLGGVLVQLLTAPLAVAADAASYLGSAYFLSRIRPAEPPPDPARRGTLTAGARYIAGHGVVRASLIAAAVINFFNFMFVTLFALYATRSLHVRPGELGVVLGAGAVGGVLGSLATQRITGRVGVGWGYVIGAVLFPAPLLLVPLAGGPHALILAALFASEFLSGAGVMVLDISIGSIFAAVIPDRLRSRVTGAFQAVNYGSRPVGSLVAGALGGAIGVRPTLWIAAAGGATAFVWLLPTPLPRFRMPDTGKPPNVTVETGTIVSDS